MSDIQFTRIRCTCCGAEFENIAPDQTIFVCRRIGCGAKFFVSRGEQFAHIEEERAQHIETHRRALKSALREFQTEQIRYCASVITGMIPDDFSARVAQCVYGMTVSGGDPRPFREYMSSVKDVTEEEFIESIELALPYVQYSDLKTIDDALKRIVVSPRKRYLNELIKKRRAEIARQIDDTADIERDVFVCASSADKKDSETLYSLLISKGLKPWSALHNINPHSVDYWLDIERAIDRCKSFLLICSDDAMLSPNVLREINRAKDKRKPFVGIRIDESKLSNAFLSVISESDFIMAYSDVVSAFDTVFSRLEAALASVAVKPKLKMRDKRARRTEVKPETDSPAKIPTGELTPAAPFPKLRKAKMTFTAIAEGEPDVGVKNIIIDKKAYADKATEPEILTAPKFPAPRGLKKPEITLAPAKISEEPLLTAPALTVPRRKTEADARGCCCACGGYLYYISGGRLRCMRPDGSMNFDITGLCADTLCLTGGRLYAIKYGENVYVIDDSGANARPRALGISPDGGICAYGGKLYYSKGERVCSYSVDTNLSETLVKGAVASSFVSTPRGAVYLDSSRANDARLCLIADGEPITLDSGDIVPDSPSPFGSKIAYIKREGKTCLYTLSVKDFNPRRRLDANDGEWAAERAFADGSRTYLLMSNKSERKLLGYELTSRSPTSETMLGRAKETAVINGFAYFAVSPSRTARINIQSGVIETLP